MRLAIPCLASVLLSLALVACATARLPLQADPVRIVLPARLIPAVDEPEFVPAIDAAEFMQEDEPVLGLDDGAVAKAYSLWMLDRHEIVNDATPEGPIAVTW